MTFAWPSLLWLLALPVGLLIWEITHRRRAKTVARPKILQAEAGARALTLGDFSTSSTPTRTPPRFWLCAGLVLAVIALARPQWGRTEEPVFDQSREILLAIDLSRSMLTPDVKPTRLDRAKLLIQALLEKLAGERVGLVVFAGTAFLQSPLSADYEILREFLPALGPDFLPQGGSNYGALLEASVQAFTASASADRFLVILSDGEATDDTWKTQMAELKKRNIRVLGLGLGTTEGGMIPDSSGGLVKDERGAVVMSKLEAATLQELAQGTGGAYRDASTWVDLAALVSETVETGKKGEFVEKNTVRLVERFQWPLAFALWCFLVSFYYEFPVRPRIRDLRPPQRPTSPPEKSATSSLGAAVSLLLGLTVLAGASEGWAAAKLATPPPAPPAADASLAKIVGRLAGGASPSGRDWAELASETVTWGSKLQSQKQPVPDGPVRDALAAVDAGKKLDAQTADWKKLREDLQALLKRDEEQKDDQQQNQDQQQNEDQQQQNQDQQNQKKQDQKQEKSDQQKGGSEKNEPGEEPKPQEQKKDPGESAFGDMNKKEETPPPEPAPPEDMQKVGGAEQQPQKPETDPALALPLQKLDQLRNQDSPATLFQLMDGERKPAKKPAKDW